jgi:hypothetical protein
MSKCRLLPGTSDAWSFHQGVKSCTRADPCHAETVDDLVRIVGKWERKELEFQNEYLKLVGEEPTSVVPDEMEKPSENFRAIRKLSSSSCREAGRTDNASGFFSHPEKLAHAPAEETAG